MLSNIIVTGDGYAPYLVALGLRNSLPSSGSIRIVERQLDTEQDEIVILSRRIRQVHGQLGIDEGQFFNATGALPWLGTLVQNTLSADDFMLCDAEYGFLINGRPFNKLFFQFRKSEPHARLDDFCLQAKIARKNKFSPGSSDSKSLFSLVEYGYVVVASAYQTHLRQLAQSRGIAVDIAQEPCAIESRAEECRVRISVENVLSGDLLINCSSEPDADGGLSEDVEPLTSFIPRLQTKWKTCDASVPKPYVSLTYDGHGVSKRFSLPGFDAEQCLQPGADHTPYAKRTPWQGRVVSVGAGRLRIPLAIFQEVDLLWSDLERLLAVWPRAETVAASRAVFNAEANEVVQQLIDVENLFYFSASMVTSLRERNHQRVDLFKEVGRLPQFEHEALDNNHWLALMHSLGIFEAGVEEDMGAESEWIIAELQKMQHTFEGASAKTPDFNKIVQQLIGR